MPIQINPTAARTTSGNDGGDAVERGYIEIEIWGVTIRIEWK